MFPILIVVSVMPWVLSAPAGPAPARASRAAARATRVSLLRMAILRRGRASPVRVLSGRWRRGIRRERAGPGPDRRPPIRWAGPWRRSGLPERPRQASADLPPRRLDVGHRRGPGGRDDLHGGVDLVLAPVPHGVRHLLEQPHGRILERGRPAALELGAPSAIVEPAGGRRR